MNRATKCGTPWISWTPLAKYKNRFWSKYVIFFAIFLPEKLTKFGIFPFFILLSKNAWLEKWLDYYFNIILDNNNKNSMALLLSLLTMDTVIVTWMILIVSSVLFIVNEVLNVKCQISISNFLIEEEAAHCAFLMSCYVTKKKVIISNKVLCKWIRWPRCWISEFLTIAHAPDGSIKTGTCHSFSIVAVEYEI